MGVYDSVYFNCPHCDTVQEEQFKPGGMKGYGFPKDSETMPIEYLHWFRDQKWTCYKCKKPFKTDVEIKVEIKNAKIF